MKITRNNHDNKALDVLERARQACDPPTWYQLARQLNTSPQMLTKWRARGGAYDEDAAWGIAELLQDDPAHIIAIREEARETNEWKKSRWKSRLKRYGGTLMIALASWLLFHSRDDGHWPISQVSSSSPYSRKRKTAKTPNSAHDLTGITIMRRALGRLGQLWRTRFARFPVALAGSS